MSTGSVRLDINLAPDVAAALRTMAAEDQVSVTEEVRRIVSLAWHIHKCQARGETLLIEAPGGVQREVVPFPALDDQTSAAEPGPVTIYRRVGPAGVNGFAEHTHDGRLHGHDGGASPHRHPLYPGDLRDHHFTTEPARVVDGLTVGARYRVTHRDEPLGWTPAEPVLFDCKDDGCYWFVGPDRNVKVHEDDAASGHAVITDLDGNRVDYWAEQARAFIADARAHGTTNYELRRRPIWTAQDMPAYEPVTFHALPRVLDEQESTTR